MNLVRYILLLILLLINVGIAHTQGLIDVKGKIVDKYGRGILAIIQVQDQSGHNLTYFPEKDGSFMVRLPQDNYTFTISKGSEYEIRTISIDTSKIPKEGLIIQLNRTYDIEKDGWYSGDVNTHSLFSDGLEFPIDIALASKSMGLSWAVLSDHNTISGRCMWNICKGSDFIPIIGEEVTTPYGHFNAIGIERLISWDVKEGKKDIMRIYKDIHREGGIVSLNHPFFPNRSYKFWDTKGYDVIEIWNGGLPPNLEGAGNYEAKIKWFDLLNRGEKIPAVAGSDCHDITSVISALDYSISSRLISSRLGLEIPDAKRDLFKRWLSLGLYVGNPRTYVHIRKFSQEEIIKALKNGNSFITNGPIILADIDGKYPGERLESLKTSYILNIKVLSNSPIDKIIIIGDGKILEKIYT
ncbi:MAG: CehA/McbA family metallohydrolase, partial [bacterium]